MVDGDTIVRDESGSDVRVRLIGVNTPESSECFGPEAASATSGLLVGHQMRAVNPAEVPNVDQYGRELRYVEAYIDGAWVDVGSTLVAEGFAAAVVYQPHPRSGMYDAAQAQARTDAAGMWSACVASSAWEFTTVQANAAGDDRLNLNGEFVSLTNTASVTLTLEGFRLTDASSTHRFAFPPIAVPPSSTVTVFTGCGTNTSDTLFWCADSPVWNNDHDVARLLDPSGVEVARRSW